MKSISIGTLRDLYNEKYIEKASFWQGDILLGKEGSDTVLGVKDKIRIKDRIIFYYSKNNM